MRLPHVEIVDRPPPGWFVLAVVPRSGRVIPLRPATWAALMIDVPAEGHCSGQQPATKPAVWVHVPGKHQTRDAAWDAFEDWRQTRH